MTLRGRRTNIFFLNYSAKWLHEQWAFDFHQPVFKKIISASLQQKQNLQQQKKRNIKFIYSDKAIQIWLSNVKTKRKISPNVCGLLRIYELYSLKSDIIKRFVRCHQDLSKCHVNSVQAFARIRINKQWIQNLQMILNLNSCKCNCDFDIFFFFKIKPVYEVFVNLAFLKEFWKSQIRSRDLNKGGGGKGGNCPPPHFGRIEGVAGQRRRAALLFAPPVLGSY